MRLKLILAIVSLFMIFPLFAKETNEDKIIVAYVTHSSQVIPDPTKMTHINYAFGRIDDSLKKLLIPNPSRLRQIVALKKYNPNLKVLLSVGGSYECNFSAMAANPKLRAEFVKSCKNAVKKYKLDGIDLNWEFPTLNLKGKPGSKNDIDNFTTLVKEMRKALGNKKLLTTASTWRCKYMDYPAITPYLDYISVMAYNMGTPPKLQTSLYRSSKSGNGTASEAVEKHIKAGVPRSKIVLGIPFYGLGTYGRLKYCSYGQIGKPKDTKEGWDNVAKAPYLTDKKGNVVFSYDNPKSIAIKCKYIKDQNLRGAMYWQYADDNARGDLRNAVYNGIMK